MTDEEEYIHIGELFDRNPQRFIEPIVKVDVHDPKTIRTELEEYVVTDEISRYLIDLLDRFIESRSGVPESVCCWISGFFGSGKSHFLKILGYVLSNKTVKFENDQRIGAATFFCKKHSIFGSQILERELETKAIFVNMINYDRKQGPSITRIVYGALLKEMGLSEVDWISEIERSLQKDGKWEKFLEFVQRTEGRPWEQLRKMQVKARPILVKGLMAIDPRTYTELDLTVKSIDDVQNSFTLDQAKLAERLLEVAESLDETNGRVVLLLDEIGLYIGTNTEKLTDLNMLAEQITRIGKGKVWLFVTAQEALEEVIPKIEVVADQFQKIRDRFQMKVSLTPENIDTVVKKRLLQKTADPQKVDVLRELYRKHSGSLSLGALTKNPFRDYDNLFTRLEEENFIESYPFMPYHIRLMQEIFGILRSKGGASQPLTGRERAVLIVVKNVLTASKERKALIDSPIGELATFDTVYNAINEELKDIGSSYQAAIEGDIIPLGETGKISTGSVAKALFLLQNVIWIPCTLENIAALLYPRLGFDKKELEDGVRKSLEKLKNGKWIAEEDGKFRFLTEFERTFENDINKQSAHESEKRELTVEVLKQVLGNLRTYNYQNVRTFDVQITGDDSDIATKGYVKLHFYSPYRAAKDKELVDSLRIKSLSSPDTIFWICKIDRKFEDGLERAIFVEKALKEWELKAPSKERETLHKHKTNLEKLKKDRMPRMLERAASTGTIIYQGKEKILNGNRNLQEIFNSEIKDLIKELFTEFHFASFIVGKDEYISSVLSWQGGSLPGIYYDLKLISDQGNISVDRPVPSRILEEIRRRVDDKPENQTGESIATHFEKPPYGWDQRIVRLTLAALFKNNSIAINIEGKNYFSPSESRSHDAFTNKRIFNKTRFLPGQEITPEQRRLASDLISEIFGEKGGNTNEEVDKALSSAINSRVDDCKRLYTIAKEKVLPQRNELGNLTKVMEGIMKNDTQNSRILEFIKDENVVTLKSLIPILNKLLRFESDRNLDNYPIIMSFAVNIGPKLVKVTNDGLIENDVRKLTQNIDSQDFIGRWPEIISLYQNLFHKYTLLYFSKHTDRNRAVEETIELLKKHPAVSNLTSEELEIKFRPLTDLSCSAETHEFSEGESVCSKCKATLTDLVNHLEMIQARGTKIRTSLDELYRTKQEETNEIPIPGFIETVTSIKQIPHVTAKVKEVAEKAVTDGRAVRIQVEVE